RWFERRQLKIGFMLGMMPHAFTRTSTSRGRGSGISTVSIRNGCPGSCRRAERMEAAIDVLLSFGRNYLRHRRHCKRLWRVATLSVFLWYCVFFLVVLALNAT